MTLVHKTIEAHVGGDFILSDATPDRYDDVIDPEGWDLRNFSKNPIALFNHDSNFPIGRWTNLRVENGALRGRLTLAPEGTSARHDEIRTLVKCGVLKAVSVGFRPVSSEPRKSGGTKYSKQELAETSLVAVPANPAALLLEAKRLGVSNEIIKMIFREQNKNARASPKHYSLQERQAILRRAKAKLRSAYVPNVDPGSFHTKHGFIRACIVDLMNNGGYNHIEAFEKCKTRWDEHESIGSPVTAGQQSKSPKLLTMSDFVKKESDRLAAHRLAVHERAKALLARLEKEKPLVKKDSEPPSKTWLMWRGQRIPVPKWGDDDQW
jgi:HK97 family phage prohead protease